MDEERKAFEAAILAANGQVPGNYNPEYDRYVSERRQGQYEGWKLARAQLPSQGGEAVAGTLHISHFRDNPAMENVDFQLIADLKPGSYKLYTHPAEQVADGDPVGSFAKHMEYMQRCIALEAEQAKLRELLTAWRRMFDGGIASGELGVLRGQTDAALAKP